MKALDPNDQLFLFLDRLHQPMHVAGLQLFQLPDDAGDDFVRNMVEQVRGYTHPVGSFRKRLAPRLGIPLWDYEDELDMHVHVRHERLVHPGRIRELLATVSAKHSVHLDRQRPLWEVHFIEGLPGRQFAVYAKVHHAVMDGVSAMRVMVDSLSKDAGQDDMTPFWALERKRREPRDADASAGHYLRLAGSHLATVPKLLREAFEQTRRAHAHEGSVPLFGAPPSILNQDVSGARRVAAQSYSLRRVRAIARACEATVNDVVLAVCSSALRQYLSSQEALPDKPLIAMVPMSLHRQDAGQSGNLFAAILANLGTHLRDPLDRLDAIKRSVREGKDRYLSMTPREAVNYSALAVAPTALQLVTGIRPRALPYNVVISNVPGPQEPLYWNRARLDGLYPVSIVLDQNALNITLVSCGDSLSFGVVGCRRSLPSMQRLLRYFEVGLAELEVAAGMGAVESGEVALGSARIA